MNYDLEQKLWIAGQTDQIYEQKTWSNIVDSLLEDFKYFIGQNFERDTEISLNIKNPSSPSFVIWIWNSEEKISNPNSNFVKDSHQKKYLVSKVWSGVMGAGMAGSIESGQLEDLFSVSLTVFIFDPISEKRVYLDTGESTIEFIYRQSSDGSGGWVNLGWKEDVYGEWEDIQY